MSNSTIVSWSKSIFSRPAFEHRRPSGRVALERSGNIVQARTRGVGAFVLLLSPSEFRFDQPIHVIVNGQTVFDGMVQKDVAALLRWARGTWIVR